MSAPVWPQMGASVPDRAIGDTVGPTMMAARLGTLQDPDKGDVNVMMVPATTTPTGVDLPENWVPRGVPSRPARHPVGPAYTLHDQNHEGYGGTTGMHAEFVQTVATPVGAQTPQGSNPKTFRAPPTAWDEDAYVGYVPATPPGVGDG